MTYTNFSFDNETESAKKLLFKSSIAFAKKHPGFIMDLKTGMMKHKITGLGIGEQLLLEFLTSSKEKKNL